MAKLKQLLLTIINTLGGLTLLRFFNRNRPAILMYHRTMDEPFIAGMTSALFREQMAYLKKHCNVISVAQLLEDMQNNAVKPYSVALTFDDGHEDFYRVAWPVLKEFNLPATLYVATGFLDGTRWLWPDLLRYILLNSKKLELNVASIGLLSTHRDTVLNSWNTLGDYCLTLTPDTRTEFLESLAEQARVSVTDKPVYPFTSINWQQLIEMQSEGLDVGSHTVSHPILSMLSAEDIHTELSESANRIFAVTGKYPEGICYPNGQPRDINKLVIEQAQACHYKYGIVAYNRKLDIKEPYLLGRISAASDMRYFKLNLCRIRKNISTIY